MNSARRAWVTVSLTAVFLTGCCCQKGAGLPSPRERAVAAKPEVAELPMKEGVVSGPAVSAPIVGHLKTRNKMITIRSGPDGPLYTVRSEDGTVLAAGLPADEFSARFPELKGVVERGVAGSEVWAVF